jgi:hypothetical protein
MGRPSPCAVGAPCYTGSMDLVCSAKGCRRPATWALLWNNPKIHTPERRKTWLACDEHRDSLSDFLDRRGFLKAVQSASDQSR